MKYRNIVPTSRGCLSKNQVSLHSLEILKYPRCSRTPSNNFFNPDMFYRMAKNTSLKPNLKLKNQISKVFLNVYFILTLKCFSKITTNFSKHVYASVPMQQNSYIGNVESLPSWIISNLIITFFLKGNFSYYQWLLGSLCIKASHKMLLKLTPGINFTNMFMQSFYKPRS